MESEAMMNTLKSNYTRSSPSRCLSTSMRVPMSGAAPVDSFHSTFDNERQATSLIQEAKRDLKRLKKKTQGIDKQNALQRQFEELGWE